jgi:UDP-3-O-[3-hydroxymyristoyl] glucosamine N-acyltransferase
MTTQEIYAIQPDDFGWRKLPTGNFVHLGNDVHLGTGVILGNWVILGDSTCLGIGARLGNDVHLGYGVTLGHGVTLGNDVTLGDDVHLGNRVSLIPRTQLASGVTLDKTPIQIQCNPYTVYQYSPTEIGVGCVIHDFEYWMRSEDPDELKNHPECNPWSIYRDAIDFIIKKKW